MEYTFWGGEFQVWKLKTFSDYLQLLLFAAAGVVVFILIIKYMNTQRNHERAVQKVSRKLRRLAKKPSKLYENVSVNFPSGSMQFDGILADRSGIYLVKAYGWGIQVYGTPDGETWRRKDAKREETFPNPLLELKDGAAKLTALFSEQGISQIKVMPMVVFAENYQTAELYLGYGSCTTTIQELKDWYKKQSPFKEVQYDFQKVTGILDSIIG